MMTDFILALGLVMSPSSQLRLAGLPVGPGELCLVAWLLFALVHPSRRKTEPVAPALRRLRWFWIALGLSLAAGFVTGAVTGDAQDTSLVLHDLFAYVLLAAVSMTSVIDPSARQRLDNVAWLVAVLGTGSLLLQLLQAWGILATFALDPWYWDRMRGWSQNPNQLAFLCCALALLSLHLMEQAGTGGAKLLAGVCLILPVWVGYLSKSDTFRFAVLAGIAVFVMMKLAHWLKADRGVLGLRSAFAWCIALCLPFSVLMAPLLISAQTVQAVLSLTKNGGEQAAVEADLRFTLWQQAVRRGLDSGLLGLGPGPHLEIPAGIIAARQVELEPANLDHPKINGTFNFEAHNTYLDLLTQGGGLALASFAWLIGAAFLTARKAGTAGLAAMLFGVAVAAVTGNVVRSPLFWFAITLCLVRLEHHQRLAATRPRPAIRQRTAARGLGTREGAYVKT